MTRAWERHFLGIEVLVAGVIAVIFAAWQTWLGGAPTIQTLLSLSHSVLYSALAAIAGSLLGFVIAAVAVLVVFINSESPRMLRLRVSSQYSTLWTVFTSTMRWLGAATFVLIVALLLDADRPVLGSLPLLLLRAVTLGVVALATLRLMSAVWALEAIMKLANKPVAAE